VINLDFGVPFRDIKMTVKDIQKSIQALYYLTVMNQVIQEIKDLKEE
jgi:hypothetical protein